MVTRERRADRGRQRGIRLRADLGRELRVGRRAAGLSQARVAALVASSQSRLSRIERGTVSADLELLAAIASVVGLDLVVKLYPGPAPVRDAGHLAILRRLRLTLPLEYRWATEWVMPDAADQRAIDAVILDPPVRTGFELETRVTDAQAVTRRALLKQRDANLACMVLVLADTPANRRACASGEATLRPAFPLDGRAVLAALRAGRIPAANGILFV